MKRIVCVGRLVYAKGVQDLIKATEGLDVEVRIVGDGVYRKDLEKIAHKNIKFLGTLSREGVREELRNCDLLVMPSYNEGLPTTLLEAGALNVKVVTSDVGAVREVIEDYVDGVIYPAGDVVALKKAVVFALGNDLEGLRSKIVEGFSWEKNAVKFLEVLRNV